MTKQEIEQFLETTEAKALLTLIAWTILKTKTTKDDQILDVVSEYSDLFAKKLQEIANDQPTDDNAKDSGLVLLKRIAAETSTTWDDFIVKILDKVV